jgi:ankyrin repeat protein
MLLEFNVEVDSQDNDGFTPFLRALKSEDLEIAWLLLDHNVDVHVRDNKGNTSLHLAAEKRGHLEVVQILVEKHVDVNSRNDDGSTPFLRATKSRHPDFDPDIIWLLLKHDADVHVHDNRGNNPLHGAAENGLFEVAQKLLECNVGVNSCNDYASTPSSCIRVWTLQCCAVTLGPQGRCICV